MAVRCTFSIWWLFTLLVMVLFLRSCQSLSFQSFYMDDVDANEDDDGQCVEDKALCRSRYSHSNYFSFENETSQNQPTGVWNITMATLGPNDLNDTEFLESRCHCDSECDLYGDCCLDAAGTHSTHDSNSPGVNDGSLWTCLPLQRRNVHRLGDMSSFYAIGKCPTTHPSEAQHRAEFSLLSAMCQRHMDLPNYSHLMDIPVLSLETNRTYTNIYCAQCHSDAARLAHWDLSYRCSANFQQLNIRREELFQATNYRPEKRQWIYYSDEISAPIICRFSINQLLDSATYIKRNGGRRCLPSIDKCAPDWPDPSDNRLCSSYTLYVANTTSFKVYKNTDCARCNYIPSNETGCLSAKGFIQHTGETPGGRRSFSFSGIMDFTFGGSDRVGLEKKCALNEIFDHLYGRCQVIQCGVIYTNQAGICQLIKLTPESSSRWLNSSCPRLSLMEDIDYIRLSNGSLILNATGQTLLPEEYEPSGQNNVTICADESIQYDYFKYSEGQKYLSDTCLIVSLICLILHITIYTILPKLRNLPGKNLLSLSCALFVGQLLFLAGIRAKEEIKQELCVIVGVLIHWSYLSAFFWMNVMGFDVSRTFAGSQVRHRMQGNSQQSTFYLYCLYAFGLPTLFVGFGLTLDLTHFMNDYAPHYGAHICWICNKKGLGLLFVLPILLLLVANLILFSITVYSIIQQKKAAQFAIDKNQTHGVQPSVSSSKDKQQVRFLIYVKLGLIMGLGWVSGFVAALADLPGLWYPFIVLNALQGAFIFVTFDCKTKIYFMVYQRVMNRPHPSSLTGSHGQTNGSKNTTSTSQRAMASSNIDL